MFKNIEITNGKYSIDEYGNIKRNETDKILKDYINNKGYRVIVLRIDGKSKKFLVHRLVALTFLEPVDGCEIVNHKDCNPLNCHVENLEWCNYSYNNKYGYDKGNRVLTDIQLKARKAPKVNLHKEISQYDLDGQFIAKYNSVTEAHNSTGFSISAIANCAKGRTKTSYGFIWKYN